MSTRSGFYNTRPICGLAPSLSVFKYSDGYVLAILYPFLALHYTALALPRSFLNVLLTGPGNVATSTNGTA